MVIFRYTKKYKQKEKTGIFNFFLFVFSVSNIIMVFGVTITCFSLVLALFFTMFHGLGMVPRQILALSCKNGLWVPGTRKERV